MTRPDPDAVAMLVIEAIADLTVGEADVVLEAARIAFRIIPGPTTNRDAREMIERLKEHP